MRTTPRRWLRGSCPHTATAPLAHAPGTLIRLRDAAFACVMLLDLEPEAVGQLTISSGPVQLELELLASEAAVLAAQLTALARLGGTR